MAEPTRERVRATIGLVGGYWRPLAAVARLLEELGELAELSLALTDRDAPRAPVGIDSGGGRFASELADLWIITTALSDQFLGAVAEPDSYTVGAPGDGVDSASRENGRVSHDLLSALVVAAGQIARIVNYYNGPKIPRSFDGWISLSDAVVRFHRVLSEMAQAHDIDLAEAVNAKLNAIPTIDSARFTAGGHDPSTASSLDLFRGSHAPGADFDIDSARMWGGPEWLSSSVASVQAIAADLMSFTRAAPWERLDAYLICSSRQFSSGAILEEWLKRLLGEIAACDPTAGAKTAVRGPDDGVPWTFTFNGLCLLVSVFSPPRPASDPHHSPAWTFVLLGMEHAGENPAAQ